MFDFFNRNEKKITNLILNINKNPKELHWMLEDLLKLVKKVDYDEKIKEGILNLEGFLSSQQDKEKFKQIVEVIDEKYEQLFKRRKFLKMGLKGSVSLLLLSHLDTINNFIVFRTRHFTSKKPVFTSFQYLIIIKNETVIDSKLFFSYGLKNVVYKKKDANFFYFTVENDNIFKCYIPQTDGIANVTFFQDGNLFNKKDLEPVIGPYKEYSDSETKIIIRNYMKSILRLEYRGFVDLCPISKEKMERPGKFKFNLETGRYGIVINESKFNLLNYVLDIWIHEYVHYLDIIQNIFDYTEFKYIYRKFMRNTNCLKYIENTLIDSYSEQDIKDLWRERLAHVIKLRFMNFPIPSEMEKYIGKFFYVEKFPGLYYNTLDLDRFMRKGY
jgi:hypothetical protein